MPDPSRNTRGEGEGGNGTACPVNSTGQQQHALYDSDNRIPVADADSFLFCPIILKQGLHPHREVDLG